MTILLKRIDLNSKKREDEMMLLEGDVITRCWQTIETSGYDSDTEYSYSSSTSSQKPRVDRCHKAIPLVLPVTTSSSPRQKRPRRHRRYSRFESESSQMSDSSSSCSSDEEYSWQSKRKKTTCDPVPRHTEEPDITTKTDDIEQLGEIVTSEKCMECDMFEKCTLDENDSDSTCENLNSQHDSIDLEADSIELDDNCEIEERGIEIKENDDENKNIQSDNENEDNDSSSESSSSDSSSESSGSESSDSDSCSCHSDGNRWSCDETDYVDYRCPRSCPCRRGRRVRFRSIPRIMDVIEPLHKKLLKVRLLCYDHMEQFICCKNECDKRWQRKRPPRYRLDSDYNKSDLNLCLFSWGVWKPPTNKSRTYKCSAG